jgi:hypothetical protein
MCSSASIANARVDQYCSIGNAKVVVCIGNAIVL